jgi:hypothetical protein
MFTINEAIKLYNEELDKVYENQVKKEITNHGIIWISPHSLIKNKNPTYYNEKFQEFLIRHNIKTVKDNI